MEVLAKQICDGGRSVSSDHEPGTASSPFYRPTRQTGSLDRKKVKSLLQNERRDAAYLWRKGILADASAYTA